MSPVLSSPTNSSLASVAKQLCEELGGHWSGAKGMARCPAHDDRTPSLGVTLGRRAILFHCFAGCSQDQVLTALAGRGVSPASMFSGQVEINAGDGARKPAHHAFAERSAYACESRTIITRRPRAEGKDWNDALQAWLQSKS